MRPSILLLSGTYPYEGGEQFLHLEISILSDFFDIYILPCGIKTTKKIYEIPKNTYFLQKEALSIMASKKNKQCLAKAFFPSVLRLIEEGHNNIFHFIHPLGIARATWRVIRAQIISQVINKIIIKKQINLIYSYWMSYEALAATIAKDQSKTNIPIISRAHGHDLYEYANSPKYCPFQEYIIRNIDRAITISNDGEKYLKQKYCKFDKKINTSRLGVLSGKKSLPSCDGIFRIISCSSLIPLKRVHLILYCLYFIDFPIVWTHIGDGPGRKKLTRQVENFSANPHVSIKILGSITNKEVLNFYENNPVDVFINVSKSEGIPVSIMEAFSRGIPVIATSVGGTPEIIGKGEKSGGWLLPANPTAQFLATTLTKIKQNKQDFFSKRKNAFTIWEKSYNGEINFKEYAEYLLKYIQNST